jgi:tricorn protease
MKRLALLLTLLSFICYVPLTHSEERSTKLLRFPNIHGDKIVFSYAGDLYLVDSDGGVARKITTHEGYEMFPKFSPDGKQIAFTGQYQGNTEVFIIPSDGGVPRRITYSATLSRDDVGDRMGPNNIVMGWTPDGSHVLYRTRAYSFNDFTGQLMKAPADGGMPDAVPLKNGGFASYSPDGKKLAYNYVFREFRTWKRYSGGMADDIRVFDFETGNSVRITDNVHQDVFPMWSEDGSDIYYVSDRDGYMNLFSMNYISGKTTKLTDFSEYDIKFPSYGSGFVVFEYGGEIFKYDVSEGKSHKVEIFINDDSGLNLSEMKDLSGKISQYSLSPGGERILASARGDIFSVPAEKGVTLNLTNSCDAHDRNPSWAPDASGYAYISDKSGEFNLYYRDAETGEEDKLTDISGYIFDFEWSPDSKKILWSDKQHNLNLLDVASKKNIVVENSGYSPFYQYRWSPDSRFVVYTRSGRYSSLVMLYDTETKEKRSITDEWFSSGSGAFSDDGKYLLFVSDRTFNPMYSRTEWNHVYTNMSKIYAVPVKEGVKPLFAPENDDVKSDSLQNDKEEKENNGEYCFDDLERKIVELPVSTSFYRDVHMVKGKIYYRSRRGSFMFDPEKRKETPLNSTILFAPGYNKVLSVKGDEVVVSGIPLAPVSGGKRVSFEGVRKVVDYEKEWMQIYNETWRQMRDFFYAGNMHGVEWEKVREKYSLLVPYVAHRSDLTYLIGEMIGELNVGHAYSQNGEKPEPSRIKMGLLGADFEKDQSGYFKIVRILEGANWSDALRSPLTSGGADVKEGDYLIAVNGVLTKNVANIGQLLAGTAESLIEMTVGDAPEIEGSREILVKPISDESSLRYYNWVQGNIRKVDEATDGKVGYIHIPDMGVAGLNEFVKHYYPQLGKKALIIDDRGNGGGNVSPMIIERLKRSVTYITMHTNQREGELNPTGTFDGPMTLLVNEYSASDGDLFPYRFRKAGLGKIIGRRTWGGVVGYSGTIPVVDGGSIVTPSYSPFASDGSGWIIEGEGVVPDIVVENDPYLEYNGVDSQLEKAIEVILDEMEEYEYKSVEIPDFPDKSVR